MDGQSYIEIDRVDLSLSAAQRTALGLGPIGSDPRDAAARAQVMRPIPGGHRCIGTVTHPFERAASTRAQIRAALVAAARALLDGIHNAETESALVGQRIRVD